MVVFILAFREECISVGILVGQFSRLSVALITANKLPVVCGSRCSNDFAANQQWKDARKYSTYELQPSSAARLLVSFLVARAFLGAAIFRWLS